MSRKNSKQSRYDAMSQRDIRRLERKKRNKDPRRDSVDWTTQVARKLNEAKEGETDAG